MKGGSIAADNNLGRSYVFPSCGCELFDGSGPSTTPHAASAPLVTSSTFKANRNELVLDARILPSPRPLAVGSRLAEGGREGWDTVGFRVAYAVCSQGCAHSAAACESKRSMVPAPLACYSEVLGPKVASSS